MNPEPYFVYILRCKNGTYYVGHTRNVLERFHHHRNGKGANFTRQNPPVELVYSEIHASQLSAMQRELQLKKWSHPKKEALIQGDREKLRSLAKRRSRRT